MLTCLLNLQIVAQNDIFFYFNLLWWPLLVHCVLQYVMILMREAEIVKMRLVCVTDMNVWGEYVSVEIFLFKCNTNCHYAYHHYFLKEKVFLLFTK